MIQEEASTLVGYYKEHAQELISMKNEIGVNHPATRYIEALERHIEYLEDEYVPSQNACTISDMRNASVGTNIQPLLIPEGINKLLMESLSHHHAARYPKKDNGNETAKTTATTA